MRLERILLIFFLTVAISGQTRNQTTQTNPTTPTTQQAAAKATIQGTVMRAGSGPLKRARVTLNRQGQGQLMNQGGGRAGALAGALQGGLDPGGRIGEQVQQIVQTAMGAMTTNAVTDDSGRFQFNGVDPGAYRVSVARDGYIRQEYGQRSFTGPGTLLNVTAGQRLSNIDFQLVPAGSISGRVSNEDGEPLANVQVQAQSYTYQQGRRVLNPTGQSVQTNDLGEYRIYYLTPGEYYISATARRGLIAAINPVVTQQTMQRGAQQAGRGARGGAAPAQGAQAAPPPPPPPPPPMPSNDETYAATFFPGTINPESAGPVALAAAAEIRGIDFSLRPTATVTVRGQILVPVSSAEATPATPTPQGGRAGRGGPLGGQPGGGRGGQQINVMLNRIDSSGRNRNFGGGGMNRTNVRPDGTFEVSGIIPGSYNLMAVARSNGAQFSGRTRIEVGDTGVENVSLSLRAGIPITGKIFIDGTAPSGFKLSQLRVNLMPTEDFQMGGGGAGGAGQVADDGTFTLPNVSPLEYRVRLGGLPSGAYLMAGRVGSDDAVNRPFMITGDQQVALQLQIGFSAGKVTGTVMDVRGNPYQGAVATLIPDEPRRQRTDVYFSIPTDQNGAFSFPTVPPGSYKLFAWEEIPNGAYQDPDYIRPFEDRGQAVKVDANGTAEVKITVIPRQ